MKQFYQFAVVLLALSVLNHPQFAGFAQGATTFTYQGQLHDSGTNANGNYTMLFKLYDAATGGNQVGNTLTTTASLVNGLFSVNLDFGGAFNGSARWLDITVTNGGTTQTLTPRVAVLPAPYALYAGNAGSVGNGSWSLNVGNFQVPNGGPLLTNNLIFSQQGVVQAMLPTSSAGVGFFVNGALNCKTNQLSAVQFGNNSSSLSDDGNGGLSVASSGSLNLAVAGDINQNSGGNINLNGTAGINLQTMGTISLFASNVVGAIPQMQVFTSSGTFVVPTNVNRVMIEMWGGGGGGGGNGPTMVNGVNYYAPGGGGGAGGFQLGSRAVMPAASYAVTIGSGGSVGSGNGSSGGTTSFGNLMSASGGGGGMGGTAGNNNGSIYYYVGGGGNGGNGTFPGGAGQIGNSSGGGNGGSAVRGGGGGPASGGAGTSPGGGGSGASGIIGSNAGAGAAGAVIVYY